MLQASTTKSFFWLRFSLGSSWIVRSIFWSRHLGRGLELSSVSLSLRHVLHLHRMVSHVLRHIRCLARFVVLLSCVAWLQLFPVSSPNWSMRNDLDVEAASTKCLPDDSWYPSGMFVSARSVVQCIHWISRFVASGHFADTCRVLMFLRFRCLFGLLALSYMCW